MSKINYAKRFLENGISVIPLRHRGKEPESAMMGGTWERYKTECLLLSKFSLKCDKIILSRECELFVFSPTYSRHSVLSFAFPRQEPGETGWRLYVWRNNEAM